MKNLRTSLIVTAVISLCVEIFLEFSDIGKDRENFWVNIKSFDFLYFSKIVSGIIAVGLIVGIVLFRKRAYKVRISLTIPLAFICFSAYQFGRMIDFYYGLSEDYNYFTAKRDIEQGKVQILCAGLIQQYPDDLGRAQDSLCAEFGFKSVMIGCIKTNGVDRYNEAVEDFLTARNGRNWGLLFYRKMDSLRLIKKSLKVAVSFDQ